MFANPSRKLMLKERKILNSSPPPPSTPFPVRWTSPWDRRESPSCSTRYIYRYIWNENETTKVGPFFALLDCLTSVQLPRNLTTSTDQKNVNMERSLTLCKASAHPGSHVGSAVLRCICFIFSPKVFPQTKLSCGVNTISSNLFPSPFAFSVCVCVLTGGLQFNN